MLPFSGALDWLHMLNFYRLRAVAGMELIDNNQYQRISVKAAITQLNKFVAELGEHGHD